MTYQKSVIGGALRHNACWRLARDYMPSGSLVWMVSLSSSAKFEWDDVVKYHFEVWA